MSEKSIFPWFKSKKEKEGPVASGNRESLEWEADEKGALMRVMNNIAESLDMSLTGGPKGIEMRFQNFTLTKNDFAYLRETLPKEDPRKLVYLFKFLNDIDQKIAGDNPFYREHYNAPLKGQARAGLKEILMKTVPPESMLPPKPKALEQFVLEEVHWELASRARDKQLEDGEVKEAARKAGETIFINELDAFVRATDIYRYSKLLGRALSTPLTDTEIRVSNSHAYFDLEPSTEEVEEWEESETANEIGAEPKYKRVVPNAATGFSSLERLIDVGVPREKLRTIKDETYELIEKDFDSPQELESSEYLKDSQLRMLAAMKKVAPERFTTMKDKFGKVWEEKIIKALPTSEENWLDAEYGWSHAGKRTTQLLVDLLDIFSDSPIIRDAIQKAIELSEKMGRSRDANVSVQKELARIKNPTASYDMSMYPQIIQEPLVMTYLRKALADKLAEPSTTPTS